jgi:hypothetical protein
MRAIAFATVLVSLVGTRAAHAESEHFEQIRADGGLGMSKAALDDRGGISLIAEVKAMVHDDLAIGGRVEIAMIYGGVVGMDELPLDFTLAASGLVKTELYLPGSQRSLVRPFVGLGAGVYTIGSHQIQSGPNTDGIATAIGRYVGAAPQVGVDAGRLRLALTYNAILGATLEVRDRVGTAEEITRVSQNFWTLELSFRFAGGRKPPSPPSPTEISVH